MLSDEFNKGNMPDAKLYHVHIYYKVGEDSEKAAKELSRQIAKVFPQYVKEVHAYDKPGGPHAVSNAAVHFTREGFGEIVAWLQFNAGDLSALVHPKSGDVIKDHIDYGLWVGPRRDGLLNDAYFARKRAERAAAPRPPKP